MPMSTRGLCRFAFWLQSLASEVLGQCDSVTVWQCDSLTVWQCDSVALLSHLSQIILSCVIDHYMCHMRPCRYQFKQNAATATSRGKTSFKTFGYTLWQAKGKTHLMDKLMHHRSIDALVKHLAIGINSCEVHFHGTGTAVALVG
jgi:hypothetical protein